MAKALTQRNLDKAIAKLGAIVHNAAVEVRIGVPNVTHHSGLSMPKLAAIHEFGAEIQSPRKDGTSVPTVIPERAPFRTTMRENINKYTRGLSSAARVALKQRERAYNALGATAAADVKRRIAQGLEPPNAPSTKRQKGSSKPLIDQGEYRNSITWSVEKRRRSQA